MLREHGNGRRELRRGLRRELLDRAPIPGREIDERQPVGAVLRVAHPLEVVVPLDLVCGPVGQDVGRGAEVHTEEGGGVGQDGRDHAGGLERHGEVRAQGPERRGCEAEDGRREGQDAPERIAKCGAVVADGVVGGDGTEGDDGNVAGWGVGFPGMHFGADGEDGKGGDVREVEGVEMGGLGHGT